jgi:4-amino-4-deoxy-L-arabinose transferase-like glycosyltransferase
MKIKGNIKNSIYIILVLTLFLFSVLWKLDSSPIYLWDEALYANNALEMLINHDYWTMRIDGLPTLYNTKPPLAIWIQAIFIQLFGGNELSVRLLPILSLLGIFTVIYRFSKKYLDTEIVMISFIILLLSLGFMRSHVMRSGDLDAPLSFFMSLYVFAFFDLILSKNNTKNIQYVWLALGFTGAFFTKSTACLLPVPALFLSCLVIKKDIFYLKDLKFISATLFPILLAAIYYVFMETIFKGYWDKVFASEFQRGYKDLLPWFQHSWYYYFESASVKFFPFYLLFPLIFFTKSRLSKVFSVFTLVFFIVLSVSPTKLDWYLAPVYPIMSVCVAMIYVEIRNKIADSSNKILPIAFTILSFTALIYPMKEVYKNNSHTGVLVDLEEPGFFMRELKTRKPDIKNYIVTTYSRHEEHYQQIIYYKKAYNYFDGFNVRFTPTINNISPTDTVLVCQIQKFDSLKMAGFSEVIDSSDRYKNCKLLVKSK